MNSNSDKLLTMLDVMRFAGLKSRNSVYRQIEQGLPVVRCGRLLRFRPESVREYFSNLETVQK